MNSKNKVAEDVLRANASYAAEFGNKRSLPGSPQKKVAILTCMDVRIDPLAISGFNLGDAHVIRNAGGRASDDAIRSLLVSYKFFGTRDWLVIQHTQCGMAGVTDREIGNLFAESLEPAAKKNDTWNNETIDCGSEHGLTTEWLTITDLDDSVRSDVALIANHPLVSKAISIHGYIYNVQSGCLKVVEGARRAGKPSI